MVSHISEIVSESHKVYFQGRAREFFFRVFTIIALAIVLFLVFVIGMSSFDASAPGKVCFEKFGITVENVIKAAKEQL